MIIDVIKYEITETFAGTWPADTGLLTLVVGNFLHVFVNDADDSLKVMYTDSSVDGGGTNLGYLVNGPNLFYNGIDGVGQRIPGHADSLTPQPYYQWCNGTTLKRIGALADFPYAGVSSYPGDQACVIAPTCDLDITGSSTTPATGPGDANGTLTVVATSSNGTIKYSIGDFDYATAGQTSPTFTGLLPATYTVYAKDSLGCLDTFSVTIPITEVYNVRYRIVSKDGVQISKKTAKIDILQRAYLGEIEYICSGDTPILIRYEGDETNPSLQIVPSNVAVQLLTTTPLQFQDLFLSDDRKYKLECYIDDELYWTGFNIPEFYTEPYIFAPYVVTITFSDQLAELKNNDFADEHGNKIKGDQKVIKLVAEILKQTGLKLNIASAINVFDSGMAGTFNPPPLQNISQWGSADVEVGSPGSKWWYDVYNPYLAVDAGKPAGLTDIYKPTALMNFEIGRIFSYSYTLKIETNSANESVDVRLVLFDGTLTEISHQSNSITAHSAAATFVTNTYTFTSANAQGYVGFQMDYPSGSTLGGKVTIISIVDLTASVQDGGDPFNELFVDTRIFYPETTLTFDKVMEAFLDPFRAQLVQSKGMWWIIRLSDAITTFDYTLYDYTGEFIEVNAIDTLKELDFPKAMMNAVYTLHPELDYNGALLFARKQQNLSFLRNFGYFSVSQDLGKDGNLIDEGLFEPDDVIISGSGAVSFKNWSVFIAQAGLTYGFEAVDNDDSTGAFFADFATVTAPQADNILHSVIVPLNKDGQVRFKFDYWIYPLLNVPFIRVAWALKVDGANGPRWLTYASNEAVIWATTESKNDIYVTEYNTFKTFELNQRLPDFISIFSVQLFFYFHNHKNGDFLDEASFRAFNPATLTSPGGTKRLVTLNAGETNYYICEWSDQVDAYPTFIRPDAYNDSSPPLNKWMWRLEQVININISVTNILQRIRFDNVKLGFYPLDPLTGFLFDPPEKKIIVDTISDIVVSNYTKDTILGDMIRFSERGFINDDFINEPNLYRGWFRLEDGTPTRYWARAGAAEQKNILQILLEDYVAQFSAPQRKISAAFVSDTVFHYVNALRDNQDGVRYRPMTMEFDPKHVLYTMTLCGVVAGASGEPPHAPGEFTVEEHTHEFNVGT